MCGACLPSEQGGGRRGGGGPGYEALLRTSLLRSRQSFSPLRWVKNNPECESEIDRNKGVRTRAMMGSWLLVSCAGPGTLDPAGQIFVLPPERGNFYSISKASRVPYLQHSTPSIRRGRSSCGTTATRATSSPPSSSTCSSTPSSWRAQPHLPAAAKIRPRLRHAAQ